MYLTNYFQTLINLTSQSLLIAPPPQLSLSPRHQPTLTTSLSFSLSLPAAPLKPSFLPTSPLHCKRQLPLYLTSSFSTLLFFWVHSPPCLYLSLWPIYPSLLVWFGLCWLIWWFEFENWGFENEVCMKFCRFMGLNVSSIGDVCVLIWNLWWKMCWNEYVLRNFVFL